MKKLFFVLLPVAIGIALPALLSAQIIHAPLKTNPPPESQSLQQDLGPNHWIRNFSPELQWYSASETDVLRDVYNGPRGNNGSVNPVSDRAVMSNVRPYPNPFSNELMIIFELAVASVVDFSIVNMQGIPVVEESFRADAGMNHFSFRNLSGLRPDTYFLIAEVNGEMSKYKLVKTAQN